MVVCVASVLPCWPLHAGSKDVQMGSSTFCSGSRSASGKRGKVVDLMQAIPGQEARAQVGGQLTIYSKGNMLHLFATAVFLAFDVF